MTMKTFFVGVKGVVVRDGRVLLLRADGGKGRRDIWEMPGGRIDDDEELHQTLTRELHEELPNIKDVLIGEVLHATRLPWDIDGTNSLTLVFYRVQADFDGDPVLSDEHMDWKWCTLSEALELANEYTAPAVRAAFA